MTASRIGFVGAGRIGEPMVEKLLAAGRAVAVYARRAEVRDRLTVLGAEVVVDPLDLCAVDVLVGCLFSDEQVLDVCTPIIAGMRRGSVFVSHTTGSPVTARRLGVIATPSGVGIVDAPFSGTADAIRQGRLTVMMGGGDGDVERAEAVVAAYAGEILRIGGLGSALSVKLLNNVLFAATTQLNLAAIAAAVDFGVSADGLLAALAISSGGSTAARYIAGSGLGADEYARELPRYLRKDVAAARTAAGAVGADIGMLLSATRLGPMDLDAPGP